MKTPRSIRDLFKAMTPAGKPAEATGEKCGDTIVVDEWQPLGGAQTLADAEAFETAQEITWEIDELTYDLSAVISNILSDDTKDTAAKITAMQAVLAEASAKLPTIPGAVMAEEAAEKSTVEVEESNGLAYDFKGLDGEPRWFAIWTNRYPDKAGETFRETAHKEYVDALDSGYPLPTLRLWHIPGADVGRAEVVDYHDGFMFAVGTYDRPEYATRLKELGPLKCSHRFRYRVMDKAGDRSFLRYRTDEITVLPAGAEANGLTAFDADTKEEPMKAATKDFLSKVLGAEKAAGLESHMATLRSEAEKQGLGWKELGEGILDPPEVPAPPPDILAAVKAAIGEAVAPLAAEIAAIKTEREAEKAAATAGFAPRVMPPAAAASQATGTVVAEGSPLVAAVKAAEDAAAGSEAPAGQAHLAPYLAMMNGKQPGAAPEGAAAR